MLSDEWLSRYGLLENFNASVTRTGTGTGTHTGTGTWTTGVTAIALCTSCSRAKNVIGHAQIDRLEAISFLFFRWLTAILVNSLNQSMFPFYFMLCKSESKRK